MGMIEPMPEQPHEPHDYTLDDRDGVRVVALELPSLLGVPDVDRIRAALGQQIAGGATRFVLDLTSVRFAGSAALGMLLALSSDLRGRGGKLVLAGTRHLDPLLNVTRARNVLLVAPDAPAAVELAKG